MHTQTHVCVPIHIPTCIHSYTIWAYQYIHAYMLQLNNVAVTFAVSLYMLYRAHVLYRAIYIQL